jgi:hypothetical protein
MSKSISSVRAGHSAPTPDRKVRDGAPRHSARALRVVGLLLVAGGLLGLGLDLAGAPEALLRFLYEKLLSGLDVPEEPSATAVDLVRYVALIGGILQVAAGLVLLAIGFGRGARRR